MPSLPSSPCQHVAIGTLPKARWLNNTVVQDFCADCDAAALRGMWEQFNARHQSRDEYNATVEQMRITLL